MTPKPNPPATLIGAAPSVQDITSQQEKNLNFEEIEILKLIKFNSKKLIRSAEDKLPPGFRPVRSASNSRSNSRASSVEPLNLPVNGPVRQKSYYSELVNSAKSNKIFEKSENIKLPLHKKISEIKNDLNEHINNSVQKEVSKSNLNTNRKSLELDKNNPNISDEADFSAICKTIRNDLFTARANTFGTEDLIADIRASSLQPSQVHYYSGTNSYDCDQANLNIECRSKHLSEGNCETILTAVTTAKSRIYENPNIRSNSVEPTSNLRNYPISYSQISSVPIDSGNAIMAMFRKSVTPTRSETVRNAIAAATVRTFGRDDVPSFRSSSMEPVSVQSSLNTHSCSESNTLIKNGESKNEIEVSIFSLNSEKVKRTNVRKNLDTLKLNIRSNSTEPQTSFLHNMKHESVNSKIDDLYALPTRGKLTKLSTPNELAGKPPKPPVPSHDRSTRKSTKLLTNVNVSYKSSLEDELPLPSSNPYYSSIKDNISSNSILTNHQNSGSYVDPFSICSINSLNSNRSETVASTDTEGMTTSYSQLVKRQNNRSNSIGANGIISHGVSALRLSSRSPSPMNSITAITNFNNVSSLRNNHLSSKGINDNNTCSSSIRRSSTQQPQQNNHESNPHRIFPQSYASDLDIFELHQMEQSPVIFDANLSFVMGCKQQVKQNIRPSPSHKNPQTFSNHLSDKISKFLKRTDHVLDEWKTVGKRNSICSGDDTISLIEKQRERSIERGESRIGRSKSTTNILIKGFQLSKNLPRTPRSRSSSIARDLSSIEDDGRTIHEDELSEMTVDLADERSTSNIASERLEAEMAERLKLEKEIQEQHKKVKNLQEVSEKLEMELICAKSDLNGISDEEDGENDDTSGGVYKLKYERVARELEFTKRRLQTQHEHDLEQLVGLKKQLEKKLADAYEEVEEQRQVVGQWKRKSQKMSNEQNDLKMLLEEQNNRNNLLEKKQRKFDLECQALQDAARQERQVKDRLAREKDVLIAEKFTLEQNLADTRLELDLKEEKVTALQREIDEMTFGGGTEEEIAQLRRSKMDMDRRLKEQEEELDEMAGQVQLLEQAKLRLEMTVETMRKEARREAQLRDDELEEARGSAFKKIKVLECQLENEHEERTLLLREKHELERRLQTNEELERADHQAEEAANQKLRRDLKKYKALLKDAHAQLERMKADSPGKAILRQLRNQLEDAETARTIAMKARQTSESELSELQTQLDEALRGKNEAEEKANSAFRDRSEFQAQIEENEEEIAELMKKYTTTVKQLNNEQSALSDYEIKISELETERNSLKENIVELQVRLENVENMSNPSVTVQSKRLELRTKELESRLELEQATKNRLEVQSNRHKDALEKLQQEVTQSKMRELNAQDAFKKSQKSLRELRDEIHTSTNREQEGINRRKDLEQRLEAVEAEAASLRNDLRLALQRIADLQQAMEEGDDDVTESESETTDESISDLEERLKPILVKRTVNANGVNNAKIVLKENTENNPSITVTSSSATNLQGDNLRNGDSSLA